MTDDDDDMSQSMLILIVSTSLTSALALIFCCCCTLQSRKFKNFKHNFLSNTAFYILGVIRTDVEKYNDELEEASSNNKDLEVEFI